MTDVKRLLAEATPLPWTFGDDGYFNDGDGDPVNWDTEGLGGIWGNDADPKLILHAVNNLPAYEEAVEALGSCVSALAFTVTSVTGPEPHWCRSTSEVHDPTCSGMLASVKAGRAALARLRGEA